MNIVITAENRDDYLFVVSKGEIESSQELAVHAGMIYEEFMKYAPKKVLIYQLETTFPTELSAYLTLVNHYIENFSNEAISAKVAVVIAEEYKEIGEFWETVCTNRGFLYHSFTDLDKAERWLLK
ncbi:MAG: hypothetical protein EOO48_07790 [Flavobacterium sp.]|nr:MAG: hypothetical protein EOO48_07790 [Flavobacterium sp.]